jgi:hypothetical protein
MPRSTATRIAQWAIGLAVVAVMVPQAASAAASTTVERFHADMGTFTETEPHCTDEAIVWTGGYDEVITTTYTDQGTVRSLEYYQTLNGVGVDSGQSYALHAEYHEVSRTTANGTEGYIFPNIYVQTSADGSANYLAQSVRISVLTPDGVPLPDFGEDAHGFIRCTGG